MANQWFKFYGAEYLADPKIFRLNSHERSCWITLLCLASISTTPGKIPFLSENQLISMSGFNDQNDEVDNVRGVLRQFVKLKMITVDDDFIELLNYKKRQDSHLTEAEKKAKYRDKKKVDIVPK